MADPIATVADHRAAARRRLPRFLFDYIDGGSYDEMTLDRDRADLPPTCGRHQRAAIVGHIG